MKDEKLLFWIITIYEWISIILMGLILIGIYLWTIWQYDENILIFIIRAFGTLFIVVIITIVIKLTYFIIKLIKSIAKKDT